jgi:predicted DNA-binding protein (UPF0251 family)
MKMTRNTKIAAGVLTGLTIAISLGAAGAIAASGVLSSDDQRQAVIDDAAQQLGVTPSALEDALKQALKNRVDDAVEAGRLTQEQGNALKERIEAAEAPLVVSGFGRLGRAHFGHFGHFGHLGHFQRLEAAASFLDLTPAEIRQRLADGDTLAEIAKAEGKSVDGLVNALVAAATEKVDDAVADGRLTKEQAADLKRDLEERVTALVNGELRPPRFDFRGSGVERGFGFRLGGPWELQGPRA